MRCLLAIMGVSLVLAGCGGGGHPAHFTLVPCAQPRGLAAAPLAQEQGVYRAGPLTLSVGEDLAQASSRRSGSDAIMVVREDRRVSLTLDAGSRPRFSLQFTNGTGSTALRFPACGGRLHRFGGGVTFAGSGCARLRVSPGGELLIPTAHSLRGCPLRAGSHRLGSGAFPYLGVSCGVPNVVTCDRVGIGVTLRQAAALVVVRVARRTVTLSPPGAARSGLWLGYLNDAGLRGGPLAVRARRDHWYGWPLVAPRIVLSVYFSDGTVASLAGVDQLHAGFG
jgi:hypothetical protein